MLRPLFLSYPGRTGSNLDQGQSIATRTTARPTPKSSKSDPPPSFGIFATPENSAFYANFQYDRLHAHSRDIRIIKLLPTLRQGSIQCELLPAKPVAQLKNRFRALSYCAGDPSKTAPIFLSGLPFNVFENLNRALSQVLNFWKAKHGEDEECLLWVDQICIDQHNHLERSHQVAFMRDIYLEAYETFVCLASPASQHHRIDNATPGPRSLDWLHLLSLYTTATEGRNFSESSILRTLLSHVGEPNFLSGWLNFYDLIGSPWWSRAWVRQELVCSARVQVMHQDGWITWASLSKILYSLCRVLRDLSIYRHRVEEALTDLELVGLKTPSRAVTRDALAKVFVQNQQHSRGLAAIILLAELKESWRGDEDLKVVLAMSHHCKSSDPRDRMYAFLGLAHPGYCVPVDYDAANDLDSVLAETASRILAFENTLDIFTYAIATRDDRSARLASWIPDWPATEYLPTGQFCHIPNDGFFLRPSSHSQFRHQPVSTVSASHDGHLRLQVAGLRFDSLQEHLPVFANARYYSAFATARGYTVRCRSAVQAGDELWLLRGARWLLVLRPQATSPIVDAPSSKHRCYTLVSEAEDVDLLKRPTDRIPFGETIALAVAQGLEEIFII